MAECSDVSEAAVLFETMQIVVGKLDRKDMTIEGVLLAAFGVKVQHIFYTSFPSFLIREPQIYWGQ